MTRSARLAGGWHGLGVVKLAHGTPFTVIDTGGGDINFDGFNENRPILLDESLLGQSIADPDTSRTILSRDKFRTAQFGEDDLIVGRNTFFGDGLETVDLGIYKSFRFSWQHDLIVRFEAYNVLNKVQYRLSHRRLRQCNVRTDRRRRGHLCAADVSGRAEVSLLRTPRAAFGSAVSGSARAALSRQRREPRAER